MIIKCINWDKTFEVDSILIPPQGRSLRCGSCNHSWFFKPPQVMPNIKIDEVGSKKNLKDNIKSKEIIKYVKKTKKVHFSFGKFLSYLCVFVISFIALIIILDTFKTPLSIFIPNLELILFNLFETIRDIILFIKDLI